jgi:alpha-1,3-mannosyltransferase
MYMAIARFLSRRSMSAIVFWSLSTSIKMNSLLYAPAVALILLHEEGWMETLELSCWFLLVQGFLAVPFLRKAPHEYIARAFDFGRSFEYKWTVNWRFLPESVFQSAQFKGTLLVLHLATLLLFAHYRWLKREGGLLSFFRNSKRSRWSIRKMACILFECNLIGIIFARSLHYQHYAWYYHSVWLLLMLTPKVPLICKMAVAGAIEYAWNIFPSTILSSLVLWTANVVLLLLPRTEE